MKRVLGLLCIFYYLLVSVGVHIHLHYCKGNLRNFSINLPADECCKSDHTCDKTHLAANCCSNEVISVDLETDHTSPSDWRGHFTSFEDFGTNSIPETEYQWLWMASVLSFANSDPPPLEEKKYRTFCSLLFYA